MRRFHLCWPALAAALLPAIGGFGQAGADLSQGEVVRARPAQGGVVKARGVMPQGLKKLVAVNDFENKAGWSSEWDLGWGFAEMLSDSLIRSGKFTVLERQQLGAVLAEQDLRASGRAADSEKAQTGQVVTAQFLLSGALVQVDRKTQGLGGGLNIKGFNLGGQRESAQVAVIIRIYDTTTSEVLDSQRVVGQADTVAADVGYWNHDWSADLGGFRKTPLGEACQQAIDQAVGFITARLASVPWEGRVVIWKDGQAYVNCGQTMGAQPGWTFTVFRPGEALIDPETGLNLGVEREQIGRLRIVEVKEKYSVADPLEGAEFKRGDILRLQPAAPSS